MNVSTFPPQPTHTDHTVLSVRQLLYGWVLGPESEYLGYLFDITAQRRTRGYPRLTGALACIGIRETVLPPAAVATWQTGAVRLSSVPDSAMPVEHEDDLRIRYSLLGRRFTTAEGESFRIHDVLLESGPEGWLLTTVDTYGPRARRQSGTTAAAVADDGMIDWMSVVFPEIPAGR